MSDPGDRASDEERSVSGGTRWLLLDVLSTAAARFRGAAAAVPAAVWRRWTMWLAAGYAVVALVMVGMIELGRSLATDGGLAWETQFLLELEARLPLSFSSAVWIQTLGTDITLVLLVVSAAGLAIWNYRPVLGLTIVVGFVGLDLVVRFGWMLWNRARPAVILDGIAAPGFASFPSGHTGKSVVVYGLLALIWARSTASATERLLAAALTAAVVLLVMAGRLRMGVHWPSDVIAGALVGAVWLFFLGIGLGRAEAALRETEAASPQIESRPPET